MIPFVKAHACGNDFLIIEESFAQGRHAALARKLCARNTSVGADGIEFLERKRSGDLFLRLFNADGSEAELSGNGTRCVAAWLASSEGRQEVALGTHGGLRICHVVEDFYPLYLIESEMGVPRVMPRTIELSGVGNVAGAMVNVGNPHFVLFVDTEDFSARPGSPEQRRQQWIDDHADRHEQQPDPGREPLPVEGETACDPDDQHQHRLQPESRRNIGYRPVDRRAGAAGRARGGRAIRRQRARRRRVRIDRKSLATRARAATARAAR